MTLQPLEAPQNGRFPNIAVDPVFVQMDLAVATSRKSFPF